MKYSLICICILFSFLMLASGISKEKYRIKAKEMFLHAFDSYMTNAFPADELMPLSCKGRYRGVQTSRGDIDDVLGNFSLTLIDSLDTLYIMNELTLFEESVKLVIDTVKFDSNITVSVFEVNIRVVGGLLGAHVAAVNLRRRGIIPMPESEPGSGQMYHFMQWYKDELLWMADDVASRLLPAFDTPTGIPYPRINLRYGHTSGGSGKDDDVSTCTACAGTIILEFAALSRLTGNTIYEEKANRAMNYIWKQRNRFSNLVGTIINIHDGNWMRKESGVGAGIDSYYEYLLKAYVLLGDETYLHRFQVHYDAIQRYISTSGLASSPPLLLDVKMHQPLQRVKNFMDALLAFWPGLQVLFGDLKQAVAIHEILSQVMKRHSFLPEAFTTDFHVYWGHHLLRPEFLESNYFLYHSTGDPYYLDIGVQVLNNLESHARVKCGFAAIEDVRTMNHSDQMDSFVLAETFKYLYLMFAEPHQLPLNLDDYIFTTEGHILPVNLALIVTRRPPVDNATAAAHNGGSQSHTFSVPPVGRQTGMRFTTLPNQPPPRQQHQQPRGDEDSQPNKRDRQHISYKTCENHMLNADAATIVEWVFLSGNHKETERAAPVYRSAGQHLAALIREPLRDVVQRGGISNMGTGSGQSRIPLQPRHLVPHNPDHVNLLRKMGIQIHFLNDGRMQLYHQPNMAESDVWGSIGETFMTEMMKLTQNAANSPNSLFISLLTLSETGGASQLKVMHTFKSAPAQFGPAIRPAVGSGGAASRALGRHGRAVVADPYSGCTVALDKSLQLKDRFVVARRGDCMFVEKARTIQQAGGIGALIVDNTEGSTFEGSALFSMSGDGQNDVTIPVAFVFHKEGQQLLSAIAANNVTVFISDELFDDDKITDFVESQDKEKRLDAKMNEYRRRLRMSSADSTERAHARIDMHFLRLRKPDDLPNAEELPHTPDLPATLKSVLELDRVSLTRLDQSEFDLLTEFLLRVYPDDEVTSRYHRQEQEGPLFYEALKLYLLRHTNIAQLERVESFFSVLQWAVLYDTDKRVTLTEDQSEAVQLLTETMGLLQSVKYRSSDDLLQQPTTATTHAISFDVHIFLLHPQPRETQQQQLQQPQSSAPHSEL